MKSKHTNMNGRKSGRAKPPQVNQEWVIGRGSPSLRVVEQGGYAPVMMLILEETMVVGCELYQPGVAPDVRFLLEKTMREPMVGAPRRPTHYRVADPGLKAELLEAYPDTTVKLAPTPEVDEAFAEFQAEMNNPEKDELPEGESIPDALMNELYETARQLYLVAPWEEMNESDIIRVDVEVAGIQGACISVLGKAGIDRGFLIYASHAQYLNFLEMARKTRGQRPDIQTPKEVEEMAIALSYENATEMSPVARKEAASKQWPVASPDAYPIVHRMLSDFTVLEPSQGGLGYLIIVAEAFTNFYNEHKAKFAGEDRTPMTAKMLVDDIVVELTYPYVKE